ncbi:phospholipase D-like domain-containing protein [uncultured Shewanella sp.]|uniref:phospholipase D-like domain-containing protein n=1 Tax=uncultured Shewanella sp. TaxID=173975 RepID=UPI00262D2EE0|nr:phospholipase D-like domain-containing protein [uncultured Shewanella sp.]
MNYVTISDLVAGHIEGCIVQSAFFSTYSFEPDFFELEIMPLLMAQQDSKNGSTYHPALSTNDAIRWQQLERLMVERTIETSVIYDPNVYRCERSPRLEIAYHAYAPDNACQHAKLIALVLEESHMDEIDKAGEQASARSKVVFGAGSFNLTRAGWWDNIECGHFVTLTDEWAPENLCNDITAALTFYLAQVGGKDIALQNVIDTIESFTKTEAEDNLQFYFSGKQNQANHSFSNFISQHTKYRQQLEVVSPYFAQSGENRVIGDFVDSYKEKRILLPIDPRDSAKAKIEFSVYQQLKESGVDWCQWQVDVDKSVQEKDVARELHAKVYRMSSDNGCDLFMGSVNFSFKAFEHNIEAGFLIRNAAVSPLLGDSVEVVPAFFEPVKDDIHAGQVDGYSRLPALNLVYCWKAQTLTVINGSVKWPDEIQLFNATEEKLATLHVTQGILSNEAYIESLVLLENHFKNSALLTAISYRGDEVYTAEILVSQLSICMRPSVLPPLQLADLLGIFRGMSKSQLLMLTERYARLSELQLAYQSGDDLAVELKAESRSFFSEFSEVNSAFYHLNDKLKQAQVAGDQRTLDYYLLGKQPDSLYGVFMVITGQKGVETQQSNDLVEPVVRYLVMLSIQDVLQRQAHCHSGLFVKVKAAIHALENSGDLVLGDESGPEYNQQFYRWFKDEFFTSVASSMSTIETVQQGAKH